MIHLLPHFKIRPCFCCVLPECKFEDQIHKDTLCGKICVVLFIVFYEFLFLHICPFFNNYFKQWMISSNRPFDVNYSWTTWLNEIFAHLNQKNKSDILFVSGDIRP